MSPPTNRFAMLDSPNVWLEQVLNDGDFTFRSVNEYSYKNRDNHGVKRRFDINLTLDQKACREFLVHYSSERIAIKLGGSDESEVQRAVTAVKQKADERSQAEGPLDTQTAENDGLTSDHQPSTLEDDEAEENSLSSFKFEFSENTKMPKILTFDIESEATSEKPLTGEVGPNEYNEDWSLDDAAYANYSPEGGTNQSGKTRNIQQGGDSASKFGKSDTMENSTDSFDEEFKGMLMSFEAVDANSTDLGGDAWESIEHPHEDSDYSFKTLK